MFLGGSEKDTDFLFYQRRLFLLSLRVLLSILTLVSSSLNVDLYTFDNCEY